MAESARSSQKTVAHKSLHLVQYLLGDFHPRNFAIQLWDGSAWAPEAGQFCCFTWRIHDPGLLLTLLTSASEVALGESYIRGEFDIDGDLEDVFPLASYLINRAWSVKERLYLGGLLLSLPRAQPQVSGVELTARSTLKGVIAKRSVITMTSLMISTPCGWIQLWSIPRDIS